MWLLTWIGGVGGIMANLLGGWSEDLKTLLLFMAVDFFMGLAIAAFWKKSNKSQSGALSSTSAWMGIMKKGGTLLVILVANRLDIMMGMDYIRTTTIIAFIVNEVISITENIAIMGIPLPGVITKAIDVLKTKNVGEGE